MFSSLLLLAPLNAALAGEPSCTTLTTTVQLQQAVEQAEASFTEQDLPGFNAANDQIRAILPCLADPVTRGLAASVHRSEGLRAFVERDETVAQLAFAAARSIEPSYTLPTTMVPVGNPVRALYEAVDITQGEFAELAAPRYRLTLDGREELRRAKDWPTIVQVFNGDGAVLSTTYLLPGEPMPSYEVSTRDPDAFQLPRPHIPPDKRWLAASGASAVAAGGLYTWAALTARSYNAQTTPPADFDPLRARTNGLVIASAGVSLAAVALGTSAFFVARW